MPRYALRGVWGEAEPIERDVLRDPDGCGWTLDRVRFERRLRAVAGARGATLWAPARLLSLSRDGEKWRAEILHEGDSKPLRARMILDAGGRTSKALARQGAKRVHGDRLICLSARSRRARLPPAVTHIEAEADGWWYAAPLPDGGAVLAFHTDLTSPRRALAAPAPRYLTGQSACRPSLLALMVLPRQWPFAHVARKARVWSRALAKVGSRAATPLWLSIRYRLRGFSTRSTPG